MVHIEHERVFRTPIEEGFSDITDIGNWSEYWPGLVRVEPDSRWRAPGDQARLVLRLVGRDVELTMTLREFSPNHLVTYTSTQTGIPPATHERRFRPVDGGFAYTIIVDYEPRRGPRGVLDRTVVRRGIDRVVRQTMLNLEQFLGPSASGNRKPNSF